MRQGVTIRHAERSDVPVILHFIRELAAYENMLDEVVAVERGCGRLEWSCLDWNEPSIGFYLSLGAKPMDEWTVYRVTGDALDDLASS